VPLQSPKRVFRTALEFTAQQPFEPAAPPAWRETEISAVFDPRTAVDRAHCDVLVHREPERKEPVEFEVVAFVVDALHLEPNIEAKEENARRHVNHLAGPSGSRRLDPFHPAVRPCPVAGRIGQQGPDDLR